MGEESKRVEDKSYGKYGQSNNGDDDANRCALYSALGDAFECINDVHINIIAQVEEYG